ncbi:bifunctional adenosylcobinamide kinase/adenosylcobinamide-phosphate guanylyltransferase [Actinoallomurus rhizosphaericola]|uniref:bifunctional adenosylcobinamide kinase/adenosylcobinamide-phosphate guanylyltransferase n=1 Tax=Actinoallomurus rhizosphaericola TaxID=2952536 RepID=UPI0020937DDA|nr:bifunctional adenosylcobinamide kinase/adenosylcobinamide-phosphate guanylyltransferase [Actinoallomurus rhizosphaericola]MCO5996469.1 bifunctional adenosylcobinamide kinase/adenosylcobinamide-phosphate guanylyltransferase [Actinoallomurus rhizosphaericola]
MEIDLLGTAGPHGWPEPGCRCSSCTRMRAARLRVEPTRVLLDGVPPEECDRREVPGGYDLRTPRGHRVLLAAGPGARPEPAGPEPYDAVLLDLVGDPSHLGRLRRAGAVTEETRIEAVHVDHRVASPAELERRLDRWIRPASGPWRSLILGGARSGKSGEAELRVMAHPDVTYVATGIMHADDPEWRDRISAHRRRRPRWWETTETIDLAGLLRDARGTLLIDGMGTWLTAVFDELGAWERPQAVTPRLDELVGAWRSTRAHVVAVGDEVGLSIVPGTASGRAFRDILGRLNQRLAAESEETALVVAGRVLDLP